jgi:hypothetical protein
MKAIFFTTALLLLPAAQARPAEADPQALLARAKEAAGGSAWDRRGGSDLARSDMKLP